MVKRKVDINLPTDIGDFKVTGFEDDVTNEHHIAIYKGDITVEEGIPLRVHSECFTGDVLGSKRCDCQDQLKYALNLIEENGSGAVIYMRQEGRGIGLINKLRTYDLQEQGYDTVQANHQLGFSADLRSYSQAAEMIKQLGIKKIKLLTNNPKKIEGLKNEGIDVIERVPIIMKPNENNKKYLETKKSKLNHLMEL